MRSRRYAILGIAMMVMPILTAWVLQAQAASPRDLTLAAQATVIASPVAPSGQAALTSQDRQRLAYVELAADAMANVVDVLQIESGLVLLPPIGTASRPAVTPGAGQTSATATGTPTAASLPTTIPTGAAPATPGATIGIPTAASAPASIPTGAAPATPGATAVSTPSSVAPALATVAPLTPGQTQGPAGPTAAPPLLPSVRIARPGEMVDFIGHARAVLRVAADGLNNLDWGATGSRAAASRIVQVCPNQGSSVEAAENALRNLEGELRRGEPGPVVVDPLVMRNVLDTHAHLQASRVCMTGATTSIMGTTTPTAGMTPGALVTPVATASLLVSPAATVTTPGATPRAAIPGAGLTPGALGAPVTTPLALTPSAASAASAASTPSTAGTPGALGTPAATPTAGGVSTEERLNAVDRAIQAIQAQLNALFGGARPTPTATPIR